MNKKMCIKVFMPATRLCSTSLTEKKKKNLNEQTVSQAVNFWK